MSSPFTTIEEFNNAIDGPTEGAIYTFAQSPAINTIALLAAVGIFVWFIVATYSTKTSPSSSMDKSLNHLSTFIVVSLLSVVTATGYYAHRSPRTEQPTANSAPALREGGSHQASGKTPLGLLGMVGIGLPKLRRRSKRKTQRRQQPSAFVGDYFRDYRARR